MRDIILVAFPRTLGGATLFGVALGFMNLRFGWDLELSVGASDIAVPQDLESCLALGIFGCLCLGFSYLAESPQVRKFFAQGPRAWASVVLGGALLLGVGYCLVDRYSYESRGEWAAATGRVAVLREELAAEKDGAGKASAWMKVACEWGGAKVVEVLLNAGAAVDTKDDRGLPALHLAAWEGQVETVRLLLKRGAAVNQVETKNGCSALHFAAAYGNIDQDQRLEVLEVLLAAGANPSLESRFQSTAAQLAQSFLNPRVQARLEAATR